MQNKSVIHRETITHKKKTHSQGSLLLLLCYYLVLFLFTALAKCVMPTRPRPEIIVTKYLIISTLKCTARHKQGQPVCFSLSMKGEAQKPLLYL